MLQENPKLRFTIREIPEGRSERTVMLEGGDISLHVGAFRGGRLALRFFKTEHFIEAVLDADVCVELTCDRSTDLFEQAVHASYRVLFKPDAEESVDQSGAIRPFTGQGQWIELVTDVRDSIALALPAHPLHPRFLDASGEPIDFQPVSFGPSSSDDGEQDIDPRWSGLKTLINH